MWPILRVWVRVQHSVLQDVMPELLQCNAALRMGSAGMSMWYDPT